MSDMTTPERVDTRSSVQIRFGAIGMHAETVGGNKRGASTSAFDGRRERTTIIVFVSIIVLAFLGLGYRCYHLQVAKADRYAELSLQQQCSHLPLESQRGAILDTRGRVLAASNQKRIVFADPQDIEDPKEAANALAPILDMGGHIICKMINESSSPRYVVLQADASRDQCEAVGAMRGIGVQSVWQRHYPTGRLASHVVGFTSRDNRGLGGIENRYDSELRGEGAKRVFFVDVRRRPLSLCLSREDVDSGIPTHGRSVILTLDATIQQFAREALMEQYKSFEAEGGLAVVVDPQTGAILAMVSLPDFDPTDIGSADPNHFFNRALTEQYEPGSIIKPIITAIALDTGAITRNRVIFCENGNYSGKGFGRIKEYRRGYGDLPIRDIIKYSSNIGMAKIGQIMGAEKLYEGLTLFGFGKPVDIKLPGEAVGQLAPIDQWTGYSITRIPFGHEISVTALQMVRAYCMLANGGRMVQPYIVKAIVSPDGSIQDVRPPSLRLGYVIKPEVAKWVITEAMTAVVNEEDGTGRRAKLEGRNVFGKTGTAQLARSDGRGYEEDAYIASFVGGAPAENPKVIVLVSIRKPNRALKKGYTGGSVAAPVVGTILDKTLTYLEGIERWKPISAEVASNARSARTSR